MNTSRIEDLLEQILHKLSNIDAQLDDIKQELEVNGQGTFAAQVIGMLYEIKTEISFQK
jgi:hypothetical protein